MRMSLTLQLHFNRTVGALTPRLLRFMDSDHSDRGQKREDFKQKKKAFLTKVFGSFFSHRLFFLKNFCLRKKFVFFSKRKF